MELAYQGIGEITYPLNYISAIFSNEDEMVIGTVWAYKTNYLDLLAPYPQSVYYL